MTPSLKPIAIVGPTASGKTRLAVEISRGFQGEILSADSRQLYRGMTIGTGKDLEEYGSIPYHLIDIANAGEKYNLFEYLKDFHIAYNDVCSRGKRPVICGGTGMYVENALNGVMLPEVPENTELRLSLASKDIQELTKILSSYKTLHNTTDVDTCKRAIRAIEIADYYTQHPEQASLAQKENAQPLDALIIGVDISREERRRRITQRLETRLEAGMVDEIKSLLAAGVSPDSLIYYGLEYKFVTNYVLGRSSYNEMKKGLETAIHQFAKRQMTWFRGMEKRGHRIHWIPYDITTTELTATITSLLK